MRIRSDVLILALPLVFPLYGCDENHASVEGEAAASQTQSDVSHLNPASVEHLKITAVGADASPSDLEVPAKIAFDEDHTSRVGSPMSGRVENILVKPGDVVKEGQPLLTIVSSEVEAALADQRGAEADVDQGKKALDRLKGLLADRAVPQKDVSQAETDLAKAQAVLERSHARLSLLHIDPSGHTSRFTLRAPIAGTVVDRSVLPGSEVRSDGGAILLTISDLKKVWVLADLYERDIAGLHEGASAEITIPALPGRKFPARIEHVADVVDAQARTVKVRLVADNPDRSLKPEMYARAALPGPKGAGMRVPSSAVLTDGDANVVIVALADGQFGKRRVEVGTLHDGRVAVLEGLVPGERIVTNGALFLLAQMNGQ